MTNPFHLSVNPNPSLGSFGLAPPQAKTFLASSLLAFLEGDTETDLIKVVSGEVADSLS